jgi:hypothetical protein
MDATLSCWFRGAELYEQQTKQRVELPVECRMSNVECRMSNVECRMSNVECRMSNVGGGCLMSNATTRSLID